MTRDDIIRMAREAGFESHDISLNFPKEIKRFFDAAYAAGAAAEREACRSIASQYAQERNSIVAVDIAAAIRARGQQ